MLFFFFAYRVGGQSFFAPNVVPSLVAQYLAKELSRIFEIFLATLGETIAICFSFFCLDLRTETPSNPVDFLSVQILKF